MEFCQLLKRFKAVSTFFIQQSARLEMRPSGLIGRDNQAKAVRSTPDLIVPRQLKLVWLIMTIHYFRSARSTHCVRLTIGGVVKWSGSPPFFSVLQELNLYEPETTNGSRIKESWLVVINKEERSRWKFLCYWARKSLCWIHTTTSAQTNSMKIIAHAFLIKIQII